MDYARGSRKDVPTIEAAAKHVDKLLKEHSLHLVFLATDAPKTGKENIPWLMFF